MHVDTSTPSTTTYQSSSFCEMGNIYFTDITDINCQWNCRRFVTLNVVLQHRAIKSFQARVSICLIRSISTKATFDFTTLNVVAQGNIFTRVCHSVHLEGLSGRHPLGRHPVDRRPSWEDTPWPRQTPPPGQTPLPGQTPPGRHPQGMATVADGMHPTGMHSCLEKIVINILWFYWQCCLFNRTERKSSWTFNKLDVFIKII